MTNPERHSEIDDQKIRVINEMVCQAMFQVSEDYRLTREDDQGTRDIPESIMQTTYFWSNFGLLHAFIFPDYEIILRGGYDKEGKFDKKIQFEGDENDFRNQVVSYAIDLAVFDNVCHPQK